MKAKIDMLLTHRFILIMALLLSTSLQAQVSTEYYRHLMFRESPYATYKGIHPIDAEQASKSAHYRFEYDNKNRVIMVSHQIGDELIADNGNWDTFIWFASKVTIEYSKNAEIHHYFNVDNLASEVHGNVFRAEYQINDKQQRTSMRLFNQAGEPSTNAWGSNQYKWTIDEKGRIAEKRFDLAGKQVAIRPGFDFYEIRLDYDEQGRLQFMTNYGLDGQITNNQSGAAIDRIYYDQLGNFQRWTVFNKDREPIEGNIPMVHIGEHLYDSHGNKVGLRGFNRYGEPINFAWGPFEFIYSYDDFGNQIEEKAYAKPDVIFDINKFTYSKNGLKREWMKVVDTLGELVASPRLGGAAAIKFDYNSNSKTSTKRTLYDVNLKEFRPPSNSSNK